MIVDFITVEDITDVYQNPEILRESGSQLRRSAAEVREAANLTVANWSDLPAVLKADALTPALAGGMTPIRAASSELASSLESAARVADDLADVISDVIHGTQQLRAGILQLHRDLETILLENGLSPGIPIIEVPLLAFELHALEIRSDHLRSEAKAMTQLQDEALSHAASRISGIVGGDVTTLRPRLPFADAEPEAFDVHAGNLTDVHNLVLQWLSGLGPRSQVFTTGDPVLEELRVSEQMGFVRDQVESQLKEQTLTVGMSISLSAPATGELLGAARDIAITGDQVIGGPTIGNAAAAFTGSLGAHADVIAQNPDGSYDIRYVVTNASTIRSATRSPSSAPLGIPRAWDAAEGEPLEEAHETGPLSPTTQTYTWTEKTWPMGTEFAH